MIGKLNCSDITRVPLKAEKRGWFTNFPQQHLLVVITGDDNLERAMAKARTGRSSTTRNTTGDIKLLNTQVSSFYHFKFVNGLDDET
jgi:hypothetical protein